MKPAPTSTLHSNAARPLLRPQAPTTQARSMRSTVLQSLLLAPSGGVNAHRHGIGARRGSA